jgi:hypothetical protein
MYGGTGSGLSSEGRRKARASAHAKHSRTCECGKVLHGNGWRTHARVCKDYLRKHGWEFPDADRRYLLNDFHSYVDTFREAINMLHRVQIDEAVRRGLITRDEIEPRGDN